VCARNTRTPAPPSPPPSPPQDVEFAFEKAKLPQVIADIRSIVKKDLKDLPGWGRVRLPGRAGPRRPCSPLAVPSPCSPRRRRTALPSPRRRALPSRPAAAPR
jgi:hypothetical protein